METMQIVYVALEKIKPYKNNPRNNNKAVEKVMKSIQAYGFKVPCVLDKNVYPAAFGRNVLHISS